MQTLSKNVIADFSTQLAVKMAIGATTGTLASATDSDGVALPTGTYFLTLDKNNSKKEYIKCTVTGTALTSIQSISRQGALTSGCVREHRVGANVIISDFASLSKINDILTGVTNFDSATPLGYDGTASITTDNQFATKKYVNDEDNAIDTVIATLDAQNVKLTGNQTISSGVKTFVESPIVPTPTTDMQVATKKYADDLAFAGVGDASTIAKGVVQEATQSEVNSGTTTGSTGARLYVNPSTLPSIPLLASDGSDGDVTISSGTTTLTRDMYYNNLTVNGTGTLVTAGYKIFVQGLTTVDTSGGGGGINHKGGNGGNASGVTGGTAGTIANGSQLSQAQAGKAGGNGAASAGNAGSNGTAGTTTTFNLVNSNGVAGGNGGSVGIYAGGTGGAGGTSSSGAGIATRDIVTASNLLVWTSSTAVQRPNTTAGSGSGGGGASVSGIGGGGGGSGATGGHVFLATTQLAITGTGAINANGGNGGNGGNGSAGGGGGAGGNGGVVTVIYYSKTGTGTITANGGTGGAVGVGADGGTPTVGANGNNGLVIEITR